VKKIAQNVTQPIFLSKLMNNFYRGKEAYLHIWANSVIFKILTKVNNQQKQQFRQLGENGP
jgi:hypothetical protein